jgi:hypothetical protein
VVAARARDASQTSCRGFCRFTTIWLPSAERQSDHAADALVVDVGIGGCVVDAVATARLDAAQQGPFRAVHEFWVGHYNFTMLLSARF